MDGQGDRSFRHALRVGTRAEHDRVDALVSGLDLSTPEGFARFARVHLACWGALLAASPDVPGLAAMIAALRADLARVAPGARMPEAALPAMDALAAAYMVEGSRMGTAVLRARWAASADPSVRAADAYFSLPPAPGAWRAVRDALAALDAQEPRAMRIEADVRAVFALFASVLAATEA